MKSLIRRLNDFVRKLKYDLIKICFDYPASAVKEPKNIKKILLLRHDNKIGDSIVASFFVRELQKSGYQVGVLTGEHNHHLLRFFRPFDHVIKTQKGIGATFRAGMAIKKWKPDLILDFSFDLKPKSLFLLTFPRAPYVCSLSLKSLRAQNMGVASDIRTTPMAVLLQELLVSIAGQSSYDSRYELILSAQDTAQADSWLKQKGLGKYICLNFRASSKLKSLRAPSNRFITEALRQKFPEMTFVLLGVKEDEKDLASLSSENIFSVAGQPLGLQMALVARSSGLMTPDTAWSHVASAFQVPVVVVFRYEDEDVVEKTSFIWAPWSTPFRRVYAKGQAADKPEPDASSVNIAELVQAAKELFDPTTVNAKRPLHE